MPRAAAEAGAAVLPVGSIAAELCGLLTEEAAK
jgi:hypothetical protein